MPKSGIDARRKAALEDGGEAYISRREEIIQAAATCSAIEALRRRHYATSLRQWAPTASLYYYVAEGRVTAGDRARGARFATSQLHRRSKPAARRRGRRSAR